MIIRPLKLFENEAFLQIGQRSPSTMILHVLHTFSLAIFHFIQNVKPMKNKFSWFCHFIFLARLERIYFDIQLN